MGSSSSSDAWAPKSTYPRVQVLSGTVYLNAFLQWKKRQFMTDNRNRGSVARTHPLFLWSRAAQAVRVPALSKLLRCTNLSGDSVTEVYLTTSPRTREVRRSNTTNSLRLQLGMILLKWFIVSSPVIIDVHHWTRRCSGKYRMNGLLQKCTSYP